MPFNPQQAAEDFINPGANLDKLAQVQALAQIIQVQADIKTADTAAALQAAMDKLSAGAALANTLKANAQAVVDAGTSNERKAAFQALAVTVQQIRGVLQ